MGEDEPRVLLVLGPALASTLPYAAVLPAWSAALGHPPVMRSP